MGAMIRWACVVMVLAGLLLLVVRGTRHPVREAWTMVGSTGDGSVAFFRWSYGNTGVFADEITTRLVVVPPTGRGLELRAVRGGGSVEDGSLVAGPERLLWRPGFATAEVAGETVQLRATLRGAEVGCPPRPSPLTGVMEFAPDGLTLAGDGVLVHTRATRPTSGFALYVVSRSLSLGIDPDADCPAWLRSRTSQWSGEAPEWEVEDGLWRTNLGGTDITMRLTGTGTVIEADEGQLPVEHLIAWLAGQAAPWQVLRRVMVSVDGGVPIAGAFIESDPSLRAPDRVRPEGAAAPQAAPKDPPPAP